MESKKEKPAATWICWYVNGRGRESKKTFSSMEAGTAFTAILDKRIERGTCGGYCLSKL
jgi:hypothetical protein